MRGHLACVVETDVSFGMGRSEMRRASSRRCEPCSKDLGKSAHARASGHAIYGGRECKGVGDSHGEVGDNNGVVEIGGT
jgi:hypothetical protein